MKKNKKSSHEGMTHVNHDMFLNKDGFLNGGVEIEVSKPTETQSVQVKGQRRMLAEKKSKADWY
jgi:hypothetical protein